MPKKGSDASRTGGDDDDDKPSQSHTVTIVIVVAVTVLLVVILAACVVVRTIHKPKEIISQPVSFANPMYDAAVADQAVASGGYADVPANTGDDQINSGAAANSGYMDVGGGNYGSNGNATQSTGYMDVAPNPQDGFDGFDADAADC